MTDSSGLPHRQRSHIVLIPGFAGFDALGQVEYYSGITPLFQEWKAGRPDVVLHYFDNFPTAAVANRATRLRRYLAKRIARGEIAPGDRVSLVGHSTGGLDIRRLISDLRGNDELIYVDGGASVRPKDLLGHVHRVVFLSVPHWGTNIADWVHSHELWRETVITELRAAVDAAQVPLLESVEERLAAGAASLTGADLLLALKDAFSEAVHDHNCTPERRAEAHEAASALALYLRHMASDFRAIDDLTAEPPPGGAVSPAHLTPVERRKELAHWDRLRIGTLSFATMGVRPFRFPPGGPAPVWELAKWWTYPEIISDSELSDGTDIAYRACYCACAGGPFRRPALGGKVTRRLGPCPAHTPEVWDNDGIVNTASMLWPRGENVLVAGDHMDIVGHYHLVEAKPCEARAYQSYDSLKSTPRFTDETFRRVWWEIFDFCSKGKARPRRVLRRAAGAPLSHAVTV